MHLKDKTIIKIKKEQLDFLQATIITKRTQEVPNKIFLSLLPQTLIRELVFEFPVADANILG
jgi:hypothetical protein